MNFDSLIAEINNAFPDFSTSQSNKGLIIKGPYLMDLEYNNVRITKRLDLKIIVPPSYPVRPPEVYELSGAIPNSYRHKYTTGKLCLGIEGELSLSLASNPSLVSFINGPVDSALYAAFYYIKYHRYPYGEREHNKEGILAFYKELFCVSSDDSARELLRIVAENKYRGHLPCPCKSGMRVRYCHKEQLLNLLSSPSLPVLQDDYKAIKTSQ